MKRTPAPVSTARVAATIWSGVGEVNTWPGHAASSMPCPTNPMCRGSCPLPPPDTSATFPAVPRARRTNLPSSPRTTRSRWAIANPARLSRTIVSGSFTNFFIAASARGPGAMSWHRFYELRDATRKLVDEPLELRIPDRIAEVGDLHADRSPRLIVFGSAHAAGMGSGIRVQERPTVSWREVTDLEDSVDMLDRDRNRIGGIRDLRDEAAILAEDGGQPLSGARGAPIEHRSQNLLVLGDRVLFGRC